MLVHKKGNREELSNWTLVAMSDVVIKLFAAVLALGWRSPKNINGDGLDFAKRTVKEWRFLGYIYIIMK